MPDERSANVRVLGSTTPAEGAVASRGAVLPNMSVPELKKPELLMVYPVSNSSGSIMEKLLKPYSKSSTVSANCRGLSSFSMTATSLIPPRSAQDTSVCLDAFVKPVFEPTRSAYS